MAQLSFSEWMLCVNRICEQLASQSTDDIDDYEYMEAYEAGEDPSDVARQALDAAGFPFDDGEDDEEYIAEMQSEYDQRWPQLNEDNHLSQGYES